MTLSSTEARQRKQRKPAFEVIQMIVESKYGKRFSSSLDFCEHLLKLMYGYLAPKSSEFLDPEKNQRLHDIVQEFLEILNDLKNQSKVKQLASKD